MWSARKQSRVTHFKWFPFGFGMEKKNQSVGKIKFRGRRKSICRGFEWKKEKKEQRRSWMKEIEIDICQWMGMSNNRQKKSN